MKIFLDSGAFGAWKRNVTIDLNGYIDYLHKYSQHYHRVACLDVIGDPEASYANWVEMNRAGVKSIPCFHIGEDWKWLDRYLGESDIIAFGGIVGTPVKHKVAWMDKSWKRLNKEKTIPETHCFGCTDLGLMTRYPWTSVDSTTWIRSGAVGAIFVPGVSGGRLDYGKMLNYTVSDRESADVGHVRELGPKQYEAIRFYAEDVLGGSMKVLAESREERLYHNAKYFRRLASKIGVIIYLGFDASTPDTSMLSSALVSYFDLMKNKRLEKLIHGS